ncbi:hypothetical protein ACEWY4_026096 [Coilia grayii]|uniref:Transmembrane protein 26 n=1 Tax=Coilia grayii TaxID=363190 RepID=A0ABD1IWV4_9TELE
MSVLKFLCAVITRSLFILVSLLGVWRVTMVKNNSLYWLLTILYLPLVVEMIITLKRRKGSDYKWFSPAILLFLLSIIPTIWILELHHQNNKSTEEKCTSLHSSDSINKAINISHSSNETGNHLERTVRFATQVCANDWILALHQILLILLIVGKWIMPMGVGFTRDQLSQLLLVFVGTAADILEFTSETLSDVTNQNPVLVYIILAVWTWTMLQFPLHLSVLTSEKDDPEAQGGSFLSHHQADIWQIVETLFIQDGPFLLVRLVVMFHFKIVHQMLLFFAIKNLLVVVLNVYRLVVLIQGFKSTS